MWLVQVDHVHKKKKAVKYRLFKVTAHPALSLNLKML